MQKQTHNAMKRIKSLSIILIAVLFGACTEVDINNIYLKQANEMPDQYENIISMATDAFMAINNNSRAYSATEVLDVTPWLAKDVYEDTYSISRTIANIPDTIFYVVNFTNEKGFAIVSDNEQLKGVVALVPNSNLYFYDEIDNPGVKFYFELYKEALANNTIGRTYAPESFAEFIDTDRLLSDTGDDEWTTVTTYPTKLIQNWGQYAPYNKYCFTSDGLQAVAGCIPVALAQALTYYKYPSTINGRYINWNNTNCITPTSEAEKETVAHLIHELGVLMKARYGTTGTTAYPSDLKSVLKQFGYTYTYSTFTKPSYTSEIPMIHNLYEYGPAIMDGISTDPNTGAISGHEWVIDGALAQSKTVDGSSQVRFLYHCNWGWDGSYNGYFLSNAFNPLGDDSPDDYKFNYSVHATYFITKP